MSTTSPPDASPPRKSPIWWSNGVLFVFIHVAAVMGVVGRPLQETCRATLLLAFILWQAACFGITIGYHRLHSHNAFRASTTTKLVLALLGASAFQGSIRWWTLRHRLHHRYTDDPVYDPYAATRGLLWSHMGWIFFKPTYEKMSLVEKDDLDRDSIVCWQHRNYILLALTTGFALPTFMGWLWGDAAGAFIWGGLVVRVAVWHCTFCVNSLAHWDGLQPYSDENTSRTNFIIALITCGEGNHNFHTFPHDFRSGPSLLDWDPSKWIILLLNYCGLANGLRRVRKEDLADALVHMANREERSTAKILNSEGVENHLPTLTLNDIYQLFDAEPRLCLLLIGDYVIDAKTYLGEHPGGAAVLRRYAVRKRREATWAFMGGLNNHTRMARVRLRDLAIGRLGIEGK
ncbi:fatty acid desaturase-domain-containing protein [Irpex rosettiformis]|uniref:Fatty acid desaturase-domain-containing protein n=1 Tax=Irpex rosettiformis TaxID=378272 RepID=A0ACB8UJR4_9APHY|nr:fatty acid desaturase-domain-containing protein [Irpex rosettiformis]